MAPRNIKNTKNKHKKKKKKKKEEKSFNNHGYIIKDKDLIIIPLLINLAGPPGKEKQERIRGYED